MEYRDLSAAEYSDLESRILYEDNHILIVNKEDPNDDLAAAAQRASAILGSKSDVSTIFLEEILRDLVVLSGSALARCAIYVPHVIVIP